MDLLVVESPTKARTLGKFLPAKDYQVVATVGHIRDLPKSKLGVDVEYNFKPDWTVMKGKREVMREIRNAGLKAKRILLATDPDREGEAISWHVLQMLKENDKFPLDKKQVMRITFHEITKEAILDAIEHAGKLNEHLFDAQQARRVVDRLVGYTLSPVLWRKVRRGLSAGRVQSVAVRLIVEKERERDAFKAEEYWEIVTELSSFQVSKFPSFKEQKENSNLETSKPRNLETFYASLKTKNNEKLEVKEEKIAMEVMGDLDMADYLVSEIKKREAKRAPAPPFTTSTLQQTAGQKLGWSAKRTMSVAQKLYEQGLITYHRTDSLNLGMQAINSVRGFIKKEYGEKYLSEKERLYKTKAKVAQEAHEAIRPTKVGEFPSFAEASGGRQGSSFKFQTADEERLYKLIWQRFVACQMAAAVFDQTKILIDAKVEEMVYGLEVEGMVRKFDGWMKVLGKQRVDDELPEVKEKENLDLVEVTGGQRFTEPPPRYSEATLIKRLEELGIGRPSTYAPTLSTIQDRAYVERVDGRLLPTAIGIATNDFLVKYFPVELDYQFTAKMEDNLDAIANAEAEWVPVVREFYDPFIKKVKKAEGAERAKVAVESTGEKCPECSARQNAGELKPDEVGEVVIRTGKFGKFLSCSRFPDCKYTAKYMEKIGVKCPTCGEKEGGEVIVKRSKRGREFFGCSRYPECKWVSWERPKTEQLTTDK